MRIDLTEAANKLKNGEVVALPTETVYGLAASINHPAAVENIYQLKGRPSNNPLIIHTSTTSEIYPYLSKDYPDFNILAQNFWPGPMTLVLPIDPELISEKIRANLHTAAFRIPKQPLILSLLSQTGPLVMPSANLSGKPSSTRPEHIEDDFGAGFPLVDGGSCECGLESTILFNVDNTWVIIRQGALAAEDFEKVLGYIPQILANATEKPLCPGQLHKHYSPKAQLILTEESAKLQDCVIVGFDDTNYHPSCIIYPLGSKTNPKQIAENLYSVLRQLDEENVHLAYVDYEFPKNGSFATIAERLQRASLNDNR